MPVTKSEVRMVNGYRLIYDPQYPRALKGDNWEGYVYEHVAVAEKMLKRPLRKCEVVHHLDGNRANNRVENLLVLERSQHGKFHAWLAAGAPHHVNEGLNRVNSVKSKSIEPSFCLGCGRTLQFKQKRFCSVACGSLGARKVERPSKTQLLSDLRSMSCLAVGRKYAVSDNAIRKWARAYEIDMRTLSQGACTHAQGAETSGEVKSS
jgi:hypothetical protein